MKQEVKTEVKAPMTFPDIEQMGAEEVAMQMREAVSAYHREHLYSRSLALMARAAQLMLATPPEGTTMMSIPTEHVPTVEATLAYLVAAK